LIDYDPKTEKRGSTLLKSIFEADCESIPELNTFIKNKNALEVQQALESKIYRPRRETDDNKRIREQIQTKVQNILEILRILDNAAKESSNIVFLCLNVTLISVKIALSEFQQERLSGVAEDYSFFTNQIETLLHSQFQSVKDKLRYIDLIKARCNKLFDSLSNSRANPTESKSDPRPEDHKSCTTEMLDRNKEIIPNVTLNPISSREIIGNLIPSIGISRMISSSCQNENATLSGRDTDEVMKKATNPLNQNTIQCQTLNFSDNGNNNAEDFTNQLNQKIIPSLLSSNDNEEQSTIENLIPKDNMNLMSPNLSSYHNVQDNLEKKPIIITG